MFHSGLSCRNELNGRVLIAGWLIKSSLEFQDGEPALSDGCQPILGSTQPTILPGLGPISKVSQYRWII